MKEYDLNPLITIDNEYSKLKDNIAEKFKGDWDDKVHESYSVYVNQTREQSRNLHNIRCKAETLGKEVEGLKIPELIKKADNLCREAESV